MVSFDSSIFYKLCTFGRGLSFCKLQRRKHDVSLEGVFQATQETCSLLCKLWVDKIIEFQHSLELIIKLFHYSNKQIYRNKVRSKKNLLLFQSLDLQIRKMNFCSQNIQKKLNESNQRTQGKQIKNPLTYFQNKNKQKYRQCLNMIEQWSEDLLERQNNIQKIHEKFIKNEQDKQNKHFSINSMSNNTNGTNNFPHIDIQQILSQQFVKKMESLYMKQFMLRDYQDESLKNKSIQEHTFSDMQYM